ncbi:MAG: hypothetical protein U0T75_13215 [Chitinophagales bacterium]
MEKKQNENPAEHSGLGKNDKLSNRHHGKDPATTNNEPFDEGQLETENKPPKADEKESSAEEDPARH